MPNDDDDDDDVLSSEMYSRIVTKCVSHIDENLWSQTVKLLQ